jgi:uncharacterized protein
LALWLLGLGIGAGTPFRPREETAPVPVIATVTPYGKDQYDQWDYFRDAPAGNVPRGAFA